MEAPKTKDITMRCLRCDVLLVPLDDPPGDVPADVDCWNDAVVHTIVGGYGSSQHDTAQFLIGMCDNCITTLKDEGRIIEYYNHLDALKARRT